MPTLQNKKLFFVILCAIITSKSILVAQENDEALLYKWTDNAVGKESFEIYNGLVHQNIFKTTNDSIHRYFQKNQFEKGTVKYNNQVYYDINIKYDVYEDQLVVKQDNEIDFKALNVIKNNVTYFTVNNRKFVNIDKLENKKEFMKGYYEENLVNSKFNFYIKHHKGIREIQKDGFILYSYTPDNSYVISLDEQFYEVKNKNQIIKLFPNLKKKINDYFQFHNKLRKGNEPLFMENLMKIIATSI